MNRCISLCFFVCLVSVAMPSSSQAVHTESHFSETETELKLEGLKTIFFPRSIQVEFNLSVHEGFKMIVLERSLNGADFEGIGYFRIKKGATEHNVRYSDEVGADVHKVFYRVRQADNQLNSITYKMFEVTRELNAPCKVIGNPFSENLRVDFNLPSQPQKVVVRLNTLDGKQVLTKTIQAQGYQVLVLEDLFDLNAGMYLFEVSVGNDLYNFKLLKQ